MSFENEMMLVISALSINESLARVSVASFLSQLDPTVSEMSDIKISVSEAVTNAIIHGYENKSGQVYINCKIKDFTITITIKDEGFGIDDIEKAMTPLYTSKPEKERSGMGFTVMQTFMDNIEVNSVIGQGTTITMTKTISRS